MQKSSLASSPTTDFCQNELCSNTNWAGSQFNFSWLLGAHLKIPERNGRNGSPIGMASTEGCSGRMPWWSTSRLPRTWRCMEWTTLRSRTRRAPSYGLGSTRWGSTSTRRTTDSPQRSASPGLRSETSPSTTASLSSRWERLFKCTLIAQVYYPTIARSEDMRVFKSKIRMRCPVWSYSQTLTPSMRECLVQNSSRIRKLCVMTIFDKINKDKLPEVFLAATKWCLLRWLYSLIW